MSSDNHATRGLIEAAFDSKFYRKTYAALPKSTNLVDHFLTVGWVQGRDPSSAFSIFNYLRQHDDVLARRLNPLVHYLTIGREQGRRVFEHTADQSIYLPGDPRVMDLLPLWFDEDYYARMNPDLSGAPSLLSQFLVLGWAEGRDPSAAFSTHKYLWKYGDVALAGINPLLHFLGDGQEEKREAIPAEGSRTKVARRLSEMEWLTAVKAEFDAEFYARMYPSTRAVPDAFDHYRTTGWLEGRDPSARFSNRQYVEANKDVKDQGLEPLYHYVRYGVFEGRKIFPSDAKPEQPKPVRRMERTDQDSQLRQAFDDAFYRTSYPELSGIEDLFEHYMTDGWREGRNPSAEFDTSFYLRREGDIRKAGINPFRHYILHGRKEGRLGAQRVPKMVELAVYPKLTAIVPNYNHARFLRERLRSIVDQKYPNLELIILDDCSSDDSRQVIEAFAAGYDGECRLVFNDVNSGGVFAQWRRGLSMATGELIWICESDDTCDDNFLKQTVYLFQDPSIRLVFGDIQFVGAEGEPIAGMTQLREAAAPGIWNDVRVMPAAKWFTGPLAVRNLIANVGGAIFRRPEIAPATWETVSTFKVAGDWVLYMSIAAGGQIAYAPAAKSYFRQHALNTSVTAFDNPWFYEELARLHCLLRKRWDVAAEVTFEFFRNITAIFKSSRLAATGDITQLVSFDQLIRTTRTQHHIAVAFLNFNVGGGEIFPVEMLNVLHRRGHTVSAVVQTLDADNTFVRGWLDPGIPVYASTFLAVTGPELVVDAGIDIIHSHNLWSEFFFISKGVPPALRYIATLHGSYEVSFIKREQIEPFFDRVTWVYTADRNLEKFAGWGYDTSGFTLIPNGMARRVSPNATTRAELGVPNQAAVFLFAARSHPQKGWMEAAEAFDRLSAAGGQKAFLLMVGEGEEADKVRARYAGNANLLLLGFRSDLDDLLEIADFTLLPSRFSGESMPLFLIQSILAGVPVISTDIGRIAEMLVGPSGSVGVTIAPDADDDMFVAALFAEMKKAIAGRLKVSKKAFAAAGQRFSIETCVDIYEELYAGRPRLAPSMPAVAVASASTRPKSRSPRRVPQLKAG